MGLLSGGQILSAKKRVSRKPTDSSGQNIFNVNKPDSVSSLKKKIREAMETMSKYLDEDTKEEILREGVKVFELNNSLIHSVKGVDEAFWKLTKKLLPIAFLVILLSYFIARWFNQ